MSQEKGEDMADDNDSLAETTLHKICLIHIDIRAIDPHGEVGLPGVLVASLEEPEEDVLVLGDVDVARVGLDTGGKLADAFWHLFPPDRYVEVAFSVVEIGRWRNELCTRWRYESNAYR